MELVSIITPSYNSARFIAETIESVLTQTYQNWELLITDDCSNDNTVSIVRKYCEKDPRIKLFVLEHNSGAAIARNNSIKQAKGKYIAFLDSDDIWNPDFLEKQLSFMAEKDAILVFSSYKRIDENTKKEILSPFIVPERVTYKSLLKTCPIFPSTAIYDVKKCGKKYYFNEKMGSLRDDYVYWLEMLKDIKNGYGNKDILVDYRLRKTSVTANKKKVVYPQWKVLREVEKLPLLSCVYYITCWAVISYFKYRK